MSLAYSGTWAVGVWSQTVWASGVWRENPDIILDATTLTLTAQFVTASGISAVIAKKWQALRAVIRGVLQNNEDV